MARLFWKRCDNPQMYNVWIQSGLHSNPSSLVTNWIAKYTNLFYVMINIRLVIGWTSLSFGSSISKMELLFVFGDYCKICTWHATAIVQDLAHIRKVDVNSLLLPEKCQGQIMAPSSDHLHSNTKYHSTHPTGKYLLASCSLQVTRIKFFALKWFSIRILITSYSQQYYTINK